MKKTTLILSAALVALMASSCYSTKNVVTQTTYQQAVEKLKSDMATRGYALSGQNSEKKNELQVTGVSYSKYTGYGTQMDNNYFQYDTYSFTNESGDNMNFSVKYEEEMAPEGFVYLENIQVLGCSTSKPSDYNDLCAGDIAPAKTIGNLPKDASASYFDYGKTLVTTTLLTGGLSLLLVFILL